MVHRRPSMGRSLFCRDIESFHKSSLDATYSTSCVGHGVVGFQVNRIETPKLIEVLRITIVEPVVLQRRMNVVSWLHFFFTKIQLFFVVRSIY